MKHTIAIIALLLAMVANASDADAHRVASMLTEQGMMCKAQTRSKTILCIANTTDREADKIAIGTVAIANINNVPLRGWRLTITTFNDYVVSRDF